jgi:hypothetical protein
LHDLRRLPGDEVDNSLRDEARRHAALCARCGEQQQEQQWLTTQFRAIGAADADRQAPERVEIAALAAWRAAYAPAPAQPASGVRVVTGGGARRWMLSRVALTGLAAAAMALVFVWPAVSHRSTRSNLAPGAVAANHTSETGTPADPARNMESRGERVAVTTPPTMTAPAVHVESVMARAETGETGFLPLPYVEPLRSTEARHVVRVSMTSGDEMILGVLPADRRNGQAFEADVLVGEDGIARAIRVVR